jgi:hypothetical protein
MKRIKLVLLMLAGITMAVAEDRIPASMLPKSVEMEIALRAYLDATDLNLLAEVSINQAGAFTLGIDVPEIGRKGDSIQQMEIRHLDGSVHGLILVNATSKKSFVVFPRKQEKESPKTMQ